MKLYLPARNFLQNNPKAIYFLLMYFLAFIVFYFEKGLSPAIYYMVFLLSFAINFGFLNYIVSKGVGKKLKIILISLAFSINFAILIYLKFDYIVFGMFLIFPAALFLCVLGVKKLFNFE